MKKVSLKKGLELLGFTNIKINRNYNYRSGFMEKDGQTYYFSTGDLRWNRQNNSAFILVRTAKNRQDYTGGTNTYFVVEKLEQMGYRINVPFAKCDFNSL